MMTTKPNELTPAAYRAEREARGTQKEVAEALGEHWRTIQKREAGEIRITRPAVLALRTLRKRPGLKGPAT